ncbi:MAG TPA: SPW repeat protein [Candidatus Eisenbacteria bacterium]|nr:SPW repeat protein [Candidatus Eisenbacteria bacterium]
MYWITGIIGLIFVVAPYIFGYSGNIAALWTSMAVGGITLIVSIVEGLQADRQLWEYWIAGILGIVAIFAPFIFGFSNFTSAVWSSITLGVLLVLFAGTKLFSGQERHRAHLT